MLKPNELQIRNRQKKMLKFSFNEEKDQQEENEDRASDYSDQKSSLSQGKIDTKFKLKNKSTFSPKSEELSPHQEKESNNSRDEGIIEEDEDEIYYNEEQINDLQLEEAQCSVNETDKMHDDEDNISDTSQEDFQKKKMKVEGSNEQIEEQLFSSQQE
eukprot:TRINITY_DN8397_c0_g1_i3.p1 TRINITY_DN8397_c0_g1~~TRINITY_DN8397_c0_g1_i3.p1  ORF type:complete len:158 (-),score=44.70 TRINITY_DN8397_c0_g1_i3:123-596(-)